MLWPLIAILIYFVCQVLGQFVVQTIGFFTFTDVGEEASLGAVAGWAQLLSSVVTVAAMLLIRGFHLRRSLSLPFCGRGNSCVGFIAVILTLVSFTIFNDLLESQLGWRMPPEYESLYREMMHTPSGVLAACLFVPVCEEVVFRAGIMSPLLRHGVNPWIPISLSALVFGVFHGNLVQIAYALPAGFVFAIVYYLTGSLLISIACHILNNTAMVVMMLTVDDFESVRIDGVMGLLPALTVGLVLAFLVACLLRGLWHNTSENARLYFQGYGFDGFGDERTFEMMNEE
mgnify:CR=1 FL=1